MTMTNPAPNGPVGDTPTGAQPPAPQAPATPESGGDQGFPANTPVAEMTDAQRAAYFKHHNRQADNKLSAFKGVTPQDVETMQARLQELENAQLSASDKALKEAAELASAQAKAAADAEWMPKFQQAQLKSIAAPIIGDVDRLNAFLATTNAASFAGENGEIDEEKVAGHLTALFGTRSPQPQAQQPRNWGQHSGGAASPVTPGSAGKAEAAKRFGAKT